jgi:hypothetical protein
MSSKGPSAAFFISFLVLYGEGKDYVHSFRFKGLVRPLVLRPAYTNIHMRYCWLMVPSAGVSDDTEDAGRLSRALSTSS